MKKKFVLTLALVLMVAATLVAATPIEVSGEFSAGYDFTFASGANATKHSAGAELDTVFNFTGDFWKVTAKGGVLLADGADAASANAAIYLDKALKAEGVDLGDVTLTLHLGTGVGKAAPSVLADKAEYRKDRGIKLADATKGNFGLTVGYGDLVEVYAAAYPAAGFPVVAGAKVTPVEGVAVAVGFSNEWDNNKALAAAPVKALAASAKADIAALANLDFDLAVTGEFLYDLDNKASEINADVAGVYEGIGLWVAFNTDLTKHKMAAKASYELDIEDFTVSVGAKYEAKDFDDMANFEVDLSAEAGYDFGGVSYSLGLAYGIKAKTFVVSPSVTIKF